MYHHFRSFWYEHGVYVLPKEPCVIYRKLGLFLKKYLHPWSTKVLKHICENDKWHIPMKGQLYKKPW